MDARKICAGCFIYIGLKEPSSFEKEGFHYHGRSCELRKQNRDYHQYIRSLDERPILPVQESRLVH